MSCADNIFIDTGWISLCISCRNEIIKPDGWRKHSLNSKYDADKYYGDGFKFKSTQCRRRRRVTVCSSNVFGPPIHKFEKMMNRKVFHRTKHLQRFIERKSKLRKEKKMSYHKTYRWVRRKSDNTLRHLQFSEQKCD